MQNHVPDPGLHDLHVAIIMDGNGRWAQTRGRQRFEGHRAGVDALRRVIEVAPDLGIGTLSAYAFSSDNWRRPAAEVANLMGLVRRYLDDESERLVRAGVRLSVIGRRDRLPGGLAERIAAAEAATAGGEALHLRIALDYSGRETILQAVRSAAATDCSCLDREGFGALIRGDAPDVDLLIRTSGEQRLSDFLLWECAYAEFHFTPVLWPDFAAEDLVAALAAFHGRERRFGGLASGVHREAHAQIRL